MSDGPLHASGRLAPSTETRVSSKELVLRALRGLDCPRPPVGPLAAHFCASAAGISLRDYSLNARLLAESVLRYCERFRPDAVWVSADTWVTAEAMGAAVSIPDEHQPIGGTGVPLIRALDDIGRVASADPLSQGRMPLMLEALRLIRKGAGDDVFVVACFDQYPFSLACALMGIEAAMLDAMGARTLLDAVMKRGCEYAVAYGTALAEAGADMLSGGDSPAGLLGPKLYREVALPFESEVIHRLKQRVAVPVSLHICGNATPLLCGMASSGAGVLELDHHVDVAEACRIAGPGIAIWGNLDPVGLLAQGTPEKVRRSTRALIDRFRKCGHQRFVVSSGCTLAVETPSENLDALFDAARCDTL